MKKFLLVCVLGVFVAIGGAFGVTIFAEREFRAALDARVEATPGASYAGAEMDYWGGKATLSEYVDVVTVEAFGEAVPVTVTLRDVVLEGFESDGAAAAAGAPDGAASPIAARISWASLTATSADGAIDISGGPGAIDELAADSLAGAGAMGAVGVNAQAIRQEAIAGAFSIEDAKLVAKAGVVSVGGLSPEGAASVRIEAAEIAGEGQDKSGEGRLDYAWDDLTVEDIRLGAPVLIGRMAHSGVRFAFKTASTTPSEIAPQPIDLSVEYESYVIRGLRFDASIFDMANAFVEAERKREKGAEIDQEMWAGFLEGYLVLLEDAVRLKTGAAEATLSNMRMALVGGQTQSIDRIQIEGLEGMAARRVVVAGHKTEMPTGDSSTTGMMIVEGVDLNGLAAYGRKILGAPVTAEALEKAGAFFKESKVVDMIPTLDFGRWIIEDQTFSVADGEFKPAIGRVVVDGLKAAPGGRVSMAIDVDDFTLPVALLAGIDPAAVGPAETLLAEGVETLTIDYGFDLALAVEEGSVAINGLAVGADELGGVFAAAEVVNLNLERLRHGGETEALGVLLAGALKTARIEVSDAGGRDLIYKSIGAAQNVAPETVADGFAIEAANIAAGVGGERAAKLARAVILFLHNGGGLSIEAALEDPAPIITAVAAMQQEGPAGVLDLMQVEVKVK